MQQHIKIGGTFNNGVVVAITHSGIFVVKNNLTRFYTTKEVEQVLTRKLVTV